MILVLAQLVYKFGCPSAGARIMRMGELRNRGGLEGKRGMGTRDGVAA